MGCFTAADDTLLVLANMLLPGLVETRSVFVWFCGGFCVIYFT